MYVIEQIRRCVEAESTFQLLPGVNFYAPDGNLVDLSCVGFRKNKNSYDSVYFAE